MREGEGQVWAAPGKRDGLEPHPLCLAGGRWPVSSVPRTWRFLGTRHEAHTE